MPVFLSYLFLNRTKIYTSKIITIATIIIPVQTPASKMSPINSQEVSPKILIKRKETKIVNLDIFGIFSLFSLYFSIFANM